MIVNKGVVNEIEVGQNPGRMNLKFGVRGPLFDDGQEGILLFTVGHAKHRKGNWVGLNDTSIVRHLRNDAQIRSVISAIKNILRFGAISKAHQAAGAIWQQHIAGGAAPTGGTHKGMNVDQAELKGRVVLPNRFCRDLDPDARLFQLH